MKEICGGGAYLGNPCFVGYRCREEAVDQLETFNAEFLYIHLKVLAALFIFGKAHLSSREIKK